MSADMFRHGAFSWFELMTDDVEASKKFYTSAFGWETEDMPMQGFSYTVVKVGGEGAGGMMAIPPQMKGMTPCWSIYVTVDDVDATASKVEPAGGKILQPPTDIPGVGRFCVIQDPRGAAICAMTYTRQPM